MLKKLRIKFILITMVSVIIILAAIMLAVNTANYAKVTEAADELLNILAAGGGKFPDKQPPLWNDDNYGSGHMSSETPFDTRYFSVTYKDGNVVSVNVGHIAAIDETAAVKLADAAVSEGKQRGYEDIYRYLIVSQGDIKLAIFVDFSRQLTPAANFLSISLIVAAAGIVVVFLFVLAVSGRLVKPIAESYARQKRFVTDAGHELKTPLTVISANNDLTEMETGPTESTEAIRKQVARLTAMVNNLTLLAKMDENEICKNEKFDLSEIVLDALESFIGIYDRDKKKLVLNVENGITFSGDSVMITKLVTILMENACKYSLTFTEFGLVKSGKNIQIRVKNDARGVDKGDQSKCFERFYRSDEARAGGIEGSGIGLSVAKEIVSRHKGKISAVGTDDGCFEVKVVF